VLADLGVVDTAALTNLVRLWPLAVIALGLAVVFRRSRVGLEVGAFAAVMPGLVLGGAFAVVPRFVGDCGAVGGTANAITQQGTFDGSASVAVSAGCGSLTVTTSAGNAWQLQAANSNGQAPQVDASARSLAVGDTQDRVPQFFGGGRDTWNLALPTTPLDALTVNVFANHGQVGLSAAQIGRLAVTANASDVTVDASQAASIGSLSGVVNVGSMSISLPSGSDLTGTLHIGAGRLRICAPADLGLHIALTGQAHSATVGGLSLSDSDWQSDNYATAAHRADLRVGSTFATVEINPIGGCR
jgi:hypothetical protein